MSLHPWLSAIYAFRWLEQEKKSWKAAFDRPNLLSLFRAGRILCHQGTEAFPRCPVFFIYFQRKDSVE